jgi:hypothetical protein
VTRLAGFGLVLAALFAAAVGVGAGVGPLERGSNEPAAMAMEGNASTGLSVAADGFRLVPARTTFVAARTQQFAFRILDSDGRAVRKYDVEHTKRLHLIVVRRDLTGFRHLHPVLHSNGTWTTPLRVTQPGAYRVISDFTTGGKKTVLGVDAAAAGASVLHVLPAPSHVATTDGYRVRLVDGPLAADKESTISFRITRGGRTVRPGPYLGARGHLVVLRQGDLAYSHVHPSENSLDFDTELASAGRYRAFLQFSAGGSIHTAAFTLEVGS